MTFERAPHARSERTTDFYCGTDSIRKLFRAGDSAFNDELNGACRRIVAILAGGYSVLCTVSA
jgi:hypothetical protein